VARTLWSWDLATPGVRTGFLEARSKFRRETDRLFAAGVLLAEPVTSQATGPLREGGGTYIYDGFRINYSLALHSGGEIYARMESEDRTAVVFETPGNPLLGRRPDGSAMEPIRIRGEAFAVISDMNGITHPLRPPVADHEVR
jgi:hypothetical protein